MESGVLIMPWVEVALVLPFLVGGVVMVPLAEESRIILDYSATVYGRARFLGNNAGYRMYGGVFGNVVWRFGKG